MRSRAAFTLMEVLVALAIGGMVVVSVMSGFMGVVNSREAFEEAREISHTAYMILERFRREMSSAYLSNLGDTNPDTPAGFTGFFARHATRGKYDMDEVQFTTLDHVTIPGRLSSDHAEIGYMGEYDERIKTNVLFHREDQLPDEEFDDGGDAFLMASGLSGWSLRYYDADTGDWRSDWNGSDRTPPMLPLLVRAEITFETRRGGVMSFATVVRVNQAFQYVKRQRDLQR